MDAQFWVIVIGAVFLGVAQIVSLILDYQREKDKIARDAATAATLAVVTADVRTIEKATNSMKDALVKATGDASFLEGEKAGREKAEEKAASTPKEE